MKIFFSLIGISGVLVFTFVMISTDDQNSSVSESVGFDPTIGQSVNSQELALDQFELPGKTKVHTVQNFTLDPDVQEVGNALFKKTYPNFEYTFFANLSAFVVVTDNVDSAYSQASYEFIDLLNVTAVQACDLNVYVTVVNGRSNANMGLIFCDE